jgi:acyl-CoA reductase-like NAD-dependent aldehyde dehydrogenase
VTGSLAKLLAGHLPHRVDAVRDRTDTVVALAAGDPVLVAAPEVAVAAGLADGVATVSQPGSADEALVDRPSQAMIGTTGVSHGGEALVEHAAQ